ncbi:MAG: hypothetical protein ABJN26_16655 [Stappiaceae bacterium]
MTEKFHKIPKNGGMRYAKTIDLHSLCVHSQWQCSWETLQSVAKDRGWDVLRTNYWEQEMLSVLLNNALETQSSIDAEKALKAIRGKTAFVPKHLKKELERDRIDNLQLDKGFEEDVLRLKPVSLR